MVHFVMTGRQQQPPRSSRTAAKKKNSVKLGKTKKERKEEHLANGERVGHHLDVDLRLAGRQHVAGTRPGT